MEEMERFGLTEEEQMLQDMVHVWPKRSRPRCRRARQDGRVSVRYVKIMRKTASWARFP